MSEQQLSVFHVDIDCLLDTRLAVLASFGEEPLKAAFEVNYYNRQQDRFVGVDPKEFEERYKLRDKRTLRESLPTPIVQMAIEFAETTGRNSEKTPFKTEPKIEINIYPYQLSEEEIGVLVDTFAALTNQTAHIEIVRRSYEEITPSFVKKNISVMVMYHYFEWLEFHSANENFRRVTCPNVTLLGPALYFRELPTQADMLRLKELKLPSHFRAVEITSAPFINLALVPIEMFSIATKYRRAHR